MRLKSRGWIAPCQGVRRSTFQDLRLHDSRFTIQTMRPPSKDSPLVIFSRPSYDWVNRIAQKAERVAQLKQSSDAFENISRSLEFDCARSAMSLASGRLS